MRSIKLLLLMAMLCLNSMAQVQLTDTKLEYANVKNMLNSGKNVFAKTEYGGLFKSSDYGNNWEYAFKGVDSFSNDIRNLVKFKNAIYVLTDHESNNVYQSYDSGKNWKRTDSMTGLPNQAFEIKNITATKNRAFMLLRYQNSSYPDTHYIFYTDDGYKWNQGAMIPGNQQTYSVRLLNKSNRKLFIAIQKQGGDSLITSVDGINLNGVPTTNIDKEEFNPEDLAVEPNGKYFYTAQNGTPYRFDSASGSWTSIKNSDLPVTANVDMIFATDIAVFCYTLDFASGSVVLELWRSKDHGQSWTKIPSSGSLSLAVRYLHQVSDSQLVMNTQLSEMYISSDTGSTWKLANKNLHNFFGRNTVTVGEVVLATKNVKGVLRSTDHGKTWSYSNNGLPQAFPGAYLVEKIFSHGNYAFVVTEGNQDELYVSSDKGLNWTKVNNKPSYENLFYEGKNKEVIVFKMFDDNDNLPYAQYYTYNPVSKVWDIISKDFVGTHNVLYAYGLTGCENNKLYFFYTDNNYKDKILYSATNGASWNNIYTEKHLRSVKSNSRDWHRASNPIADFAPDGNGLVAFSYYNVEPKVDSLLWFNGTNISTIKHKDLPYPLTVKSIKYHEGFWYLATATGLYISKDGISWLQSKNTDYYLGMAVERMVGYNDYLFLGTTGNGIWRFKHAKLDLGPDKVEVCRGDSIVITPSGPDSNFQWCCGYSGVPLKLIATKDMTISATAIDDYGFKTEDSIKIKLLPSPVADFTIDDNSQCFSGNKFKFTDNSTVSTGNLQRTWYFGDGSSGFNYIENHSYPTYQDTYTVKLISFITDGCRDSITKEVFLQKGPEAIINVAGDSSACEGDSITIYAKKLTNVDYQWYKDGSAITGATGPFYVAIENGSYFLRTTSKSSGCSSDSRSITLTFHTSDFDPNFSGSPRTPSYNSGTQMFDAVAFTNLTLSPATYDFTWLFGDGGTSSQSDPFYNYKYNGLYSVSLVAQHKNTGCKDTLTRQDYIQCSGGNTNPCPLQVEVFGSGIPVICKNDSFLLNSKTFGNPTGFQWTLNGEFLPGADSSTLYAYVAGDYRLIISDTNCAVTSLPFSVSYYPFVEPVIQSEGSIRPCTDDSMRLFVTTFYNEYIWSTGQKSSSIYVSNSGDYIVEVKDAYGCKIKSEPFSVNASFLPPPEICIVTVDSATKKNLIAWERPKNTLIAGYNVYKETYQADIYSKIGYRPYDSLSVFVDINSNPKQRANRYRLSLIDTCGIESALSKHHKTIHLSASPGTGGENNLIWSHYEGLQFNTYKIYRGTSASNLSILDSIPSNINSYSDLNPPATSTGLVFYQVSVVKYDTCYPTILRAQTTSGPFSQSLSNLKDYSPPSIDYLIASVDSFSFDTNGGTKVFEIFTNLKSWTASSDETWLIVSADNELQRLTVIASDNASGNDRTAIVTLSGTNVDDFKIKVKQDGGISNIREYAKGNELKIYPNPAENHFYVLIENKNVKIKQVQVLDMNGKLVQEYQEVNANWLKVHHEKLSRGMYMVKIIADQVYLGKVLIK